MSPPPAGSRRCSILGKSSLSRHGRMSALAHERTFSAYLIDVRFTPESGHVQRTRSCPLWAKSGLMQRSKNDSLFDQLVGELLEMQRHVEAECLCGLEVDHKLELGRCLYRKVAGLFTPKDTIDVTGRAPIIIDHVIPVGYQAAVGDEEAKSVDRRQAVARRQRD